MKKLILCLLLVFLLGETFAQLSGGIKGGLNLSKQKWEVSLLGFSDSQTIQGTGFQVGGYLNYAFSDLISLQPELLYNNLKVDQDSTSISFNYLSLPLMFGYALESNKVILQAGPQLGVLLSSDPREFKDDGYAGDIDLSFNMGIQVNLGKFNITGRYSIGLLDVTDDKLDGELSAALGTPIQLSIKNNNLQFTVGYKLFGE